MLCDSLGHSTASLMRFFFLFSFLLNFIGEKLQGQRTYMKEQKMNGIEMHDLKATKNG